jgi:hypothetical protein
MLQKQNESPAFNLQYQQKKKKKSQRQADPFQIATATMYLFP